MRAKEFVINLNVPINIKLNDDGTADIDTAETSEAGDSPVMVSPLQQEIEIQKATIGKKSDVISQLVQDKNRTI